MKRGSVSEKKGGRKPASLTEPTLVETLREIVEVHTAGSPVEPGRLWTNRSPRELADALQREGFSICANTVCRLLEEELHLSRRQAVKTLSMGEHPDRDAQFKRMTKLKAEYLQRGWPVVSIDTKKKELIGEFFRPGHARTDGHVRTLDHDFPSAGDGKIIPYGVYDLATNEGFVLLAQGADTGELACAALRRWWYRLGRQQYPRAGGMLVLADCGGSNGYRVALFREQLWHTAVRLDLPIRVSHLPPYCSKYNPIDHRLFCHLTRSLKGMLVQSLEIVRNAFARATTSTGLRVIVEVARRIYQAGIKPSDAFLDNEPIIRDRYLPAFN